MSTFNAKATRNSAGKSTRRGKSVSVIDTITDAEQKRLEGEGRTGRRYLTGMSAAAIDEMPAKQVRELAASLGKVTENGSELFVCDPNGPVKEIAADLQELRLSESKMLGHVSRDVLKWRAAAKVA